MRYDAGQPYGVSKYSRQMKDIDALLLLAGGRLLHCWRDGAEIHGRCHHKIIGRKKGEG